MKKKSLLLSWLFSIAIFSNAQQRVLEYPLTLRKGGSPFSGFSDAKSCFLKDPVTENFMLLLMDNKNAEYLLFDNNKKLQTHFALENEFRGTYTHQKQNEYLGGTAGKDKYYFFFKVKAAKGFGYNTSYQLLIVDPLQKTAAAKELFDIPKGEKLVVSFGNFGQYFSLFTDNDAGELKLYGFNASGESFIKTIPLSFSSSSKKKKLSDYLNGMQVITKGEGSGLEAATEKVKLFHFPEKLSLVINEKDEPSRVITIDTKTFTKNEITIDHSVLIDDKREKSYINSFLFNDNLYSLVINKKNIKLGIYDLASKQLLQTHEINENTNMAAFAEMPVEESRKGKRDKEKNIDDIKKLIKALDSGSEAVLVNVDKKGKLVLTIGTYDPIELRSSGGSYSTSTRYVGSSYTGPNATSTSNYGGGYLTERTYIPGTANFRYEANYYKSIHFKLLLDPTTFKQVKGQITPSVAEQVKDYLSDVDKKAQALNQFTIDEKEYLGYYSKDEKAYIIEEIFIRK